MKYKSKENECQNLEICHNHVRFQKQSFVQCKYVYAASSDTFQIWQIEQTVVEYLFFKLNMCDATNILKIDILEIKRQSVIIQ